MRVTPLLLFLSLLLSCSSPSLREEDCLNRDWTQQGKRDAQKGLSKAMYSTYIKVCNLRSQNKRLELYNSGYREGQISYCNYQNGFLVGESGREFPDVCLIKDYPQYRKGFLSGQKKGLSKKAP